MNTTLFHPIFMYTLYPIQQKPVRYQKTNLLSFRTLKLLKTSAPLWVVMSTEHVDSDYEEP